VGRNSKNLPFKKPNPSFILLSFLILAVILLTSLPVLADPKIKWTPTQVSETLSPNESKSVSVSFNSSENINNIAVWVVPELQPFLHVEPSAIPSVIAGATVTVTLIIAPAANAPLGTFDGTIHLKSTGKSSKTFAKPLPITLQVGQLFQNEQSGYEIRLYYPNFEIGDLQSARPEFIQGDLFMIPNDVPNLSISVYGNQAHLPIEEWYTTTLADKEYTFPDSGTRSITQTVVNGISSLQVRSNLLGYIKLRTFVPHEDKVFGLETTVPDDIEVPESYFLMLETFSFTQ